MKVSPANSLSGTPRLPGDKSMSHRAAMLAAIARRDTRIENFSTAEDCRTTIKCLEDLGVVFVRDGSDVLVKGVGKTGLRKPEGPLDCGNSGTTARLIAGLLAGQPFDSELTGDASLLARPMKRVIDPLRQMGAKIEAAYDHMPIRISGGQDLRGIEYGAPVASAQVKSCLLLAGLFAKGQTTVVEQAPTRDHTERMLRWFGVDVETIWTTAGKRINVVGDALLKAKDLSIPCDISSAAFFIVAAACLEGSDILIRNVGLNPTRTAFLDVFRDLGADLQVLSEGDVCNEPVGLIRVHGGIGQAAASAQNRLSGDMIPKVIDEIPILAVLGTQIEGGLEIRNAEELRHKESDRISAIVENLRRMNASVEEFFDGFKVERSDLKGATVDSLGDHRIAMAFAVAGLLAEGKTEIIGAECVEISFPGFFDVLADVAE